MANSAAVRISGVALSGQPEMTTVGVKTSNYTCLPNEVVPVDVTSSAITITLPPSPSNGTKQRIVHVNGPIVANNIIIDGNGSTINNSTDPFSINVEYGTVFLEYYTGHGWVIIN